MHDGSERWLPVSGYEGLYEVSDLGNVRSFHPDRDLRGHRAGKNGGLLKPIAKGTGRYLTVTLCRDGEEKTATVHTLVLTAFVRSRQPGEEARHGPAGRYDNSLGNLCWGTIQENHQDRRRDSGIARPAAKLTASDVLDCRRRWAAGEKQRDLAREFGVSPAGLSQAINGVTWADI